MREILTITVHRRKRTMFEAGMSKEEMDSIEKQVTAEISGWLEDALRNPFPDPLQALNGVFVS